MPTFQGLREVFVAIIDHPLRDILFRERRKLAKLSQEPPQICEYPSDNPLLFGGLQLRQSQLQVVSCNRSKSFGEMISRPGNTTAHGKRCASWDGSKDGDYSDGCIVLKLGS